MQINQMNRKKQVNNISGYTGVSRSRGGERWVASIKHKRKIFYLGTFNNLNDAVASRSIAEKELGFSDRHGK